MDKARGSGPEEEAWKRGPGSFRNGVQCGVRINCKGGAGAGRGVVDESKRSV